MDSTNILEQSKFNGCYRIKVLCKMAEHWPRTLDTKLAIDSCKENVAAIFFCSNFSQAILQQVLLRVYRSWSTESCRKSTCNEDFRVQVRVWLEKDKEWFWRQISWKRIL